MPAKEYYPIPRPTVKLITRFTACWFRYRKVFIPTGPSIVWKKEKGASFPENKSEMKMMERKEISRYNEWCPICGGKLTQDGMKTSFCYDCEQDYVTIDRSLKAEKILSEVNNLNRVEREIFIAQLIESSAGFQLQDLTEYVEKERKVREGANKL